MFPPGQLHQPSKPAESLAGMTVNTHWLVNELIVRPPHATGGFFSFGYSVVDTINGTAAFLKAIDFSSAMQTPDPIGSMKAMLDAYVFERDLLIMCKDKHMDKITVPLDHGHVDLPAFGFCAQVYFLIFPMANGDLRSIMKKLDGIDLSWKFRYLHNAAVGIKQLHGSAIAHQDIKPSNVLLFPDKSGKLADLGRSHAAGKVAPHSGCLIAGDQSYAPFELLFSVALDEDTRRYGCDVYLLGSLLLFTISGVTTTAEIVSYINSGTVSVPETSVRSYDEVLPYLCQAFELAMTSFQRQISGLGMDKKSEALVMQICRELNNPDHTRRGDPSMGARPSSRFSMERYISRFDMLSNRLSWMVRRGS